MIANGTAPAVDYGFKTRDDGRFEIVWKTAPAVAAGDADPFARIRASEEIEALGTTPEKYAAAAPTTAAPATGEGENTVAEFDPATEALDVHKAWRGEQAARDAATGTDWFPGTVTSKEQVDRMVAEAAQQLGGLHILVNSGSAPGGSTTATGPIETVTSPSPPTR
jgi:NAD(P)-dependent dehydrogenase (short-subunit alcohol dehydrogenase family)